MTFYGPPKNFGKGRRPPELTDAEKSAIAEQQERLGDWRDGRLDAAIPMKHPA